MNSEQYAKQHTRIRIPESSQRKVKIMFQWLYDLIDACPWCQRKSFRCAHATATIIKSLSNGTPMVGVICSECGYHDYGPVFADPDTWVERLP